MSDATAIVCAACAHEVDMHAEAPFRCPNAGDGRDHILQVRLAKSCAFEPALDETQPFLRHASMLGPAQLALQAGLSAGRYAKVVRTLDSALAEITGTGLRCAPAQRADALSDALGFGAGGGLWVQDETTQPTGSHKVRHLFGVAVWLELATQLDLSDGTEPLAVASCGNAARAAAAIALAAERELVVFVPDWAPTETLDDLRRMDADVVVCTRAAADPPGDPCVRRFHDAVADGALPFSCQGTENGLAVEGSRTLAWDAMTSCAHGFARAYIQVGGGALASGFASGVEAAFARGVWNGANDNVPRMFAVQSEAVAPLAPAWARLAAWAEQDGLAAAVQRARADRTALMQPVTAPGTSAADGILDDETYDWLEVARAGIASGGAAQVVSEELIGRAHALGRETTGIDVSATGTAGLAGVLLDAERGTLDPAERVLVLFTGVER